MHSKRHYNNCICSVIQGELEPFRNHKGLNIIFPKNFRCNLTYYDSETFLIPLSIAFLNPKMLGFLFSTKNSVTWEVKCENKSYHFYSEQ